jgi:hypothetical protein
MTLGSLVPNAATGGRCGNVRISRHRVQEVAQCFQIVDGRYNAGAHDSLGKNVPFKQGRRLWTNMRKSQRHELSDDSDVKLPVAQNFWNVVRVYYFWLRRVIEHDRSSWLRREESQPIPFAWLAK